MHIRLIAVGDRQPSWVDAAFENYAGRLPGQWRFRLHGVPAGRRSKGVPPHRAIQAEGGRVLGLIRPTDVMVILDETGKQLTSEALSQQLRDWLTAGKDLNFVIGGPDGFSDACLQRANYRWSLSKLTLPHGLARIVCVEQLYRAWTISEGHPYHRR